MAVVFLEGGCRQYQCKWRALNSIVDPIAGYVNSRIVQREDYKSPKSNSLLNLDFLACAALCD
jgi:hypothetical protein